MCLEEMYGSYVVYKNAKKVCTLKCFIKFKQEINNTHVSAV